MKSVMFYHLATGVLHPSHFLTSDDNMVALNTPPHHAAIETVNGARFDHLSKRVDVSKLGAGEHATAAHLVDYQPPAPTADHEWNAMTKRWQLNAATAGAQRKDLEARAQIRFLEAQVLPRALREAALGKDGAKDRIAAIDKQIEELRGELLK